MFRSFESRPILALTLGRICFYVLLFAAMAGSLRAQTSFYVDPDWAGTKSGSATAPWSALTASSWTAINAALAASDVTIYLSAYKADGTTQQSQPWFLELRRADYSSHRLTLDGYSLYNASTSAPTWLRNPDSNIAMAYANGHVFKLTGSGQNAIGWARGSGNDTVSSGGLTYYCIESHLASSANEPGAGSDWRKYWDQHGTGGSAWTVGTSYKCYVKQNNITVRGFEISGSGARSSFNGDNFIWEYNNIHDITTIGAALTLLYTSWPDDSSAQIISRASTNLTLRNFRVVNTVGEGIYLGSINPDAPAAFQASHGNQHSGILITNALIDGPGFYGEQGDGIDSKNGITDLHIVAVEVSRFSGSGIILPYSASNVDQHLLVERCYVHDSIRSSAGDQKCITAQTGGGSSTSLYGMVGLTIRNCLVANSLNGITVMGSSSPNQPVDMANIHNNTIYGIDNGGLNVSINILNSTVLNNFICNTGDPRAVIGSSGVLSDYNAHDGTWYSAGEGTHTMALTTTEAQAAVVSTNPLNAHLVAGTPLILGGIPVVGCFDDFQGSLRSGNAWDIGAFRFAGGRPQPPTQLRVQAP